MGRLSPTVRHLHTKAGVDNADFPPGGSDVYPGGPPESLAGIFVRHVPSAGPITPDPRRGFAQLHALLDQDPPGGRLPSHPAVFRRGNRLLL